ncbi:MAG: hypothetical protein QOH71_4327 [Blastocatellia bacterium]|nr:hypothetical protein [Blastocatellia bacterium]
MIRISLIWGGFMIVSNALWDYYFHGALDIPKLIYFAIAGPILGLVSWWVNEGEFKAAKIDAHMRELRQQMHIGNDDA